MNHSGAAKEVPLPLLKTLEETLKDEENIPSERELKKVQNILRRVLHEKLPENPAEINPSIETTLSLITSCTMGGRSTSIKLFGEGRPVVVFPFLSKLTTVLLDRQYQGHSGTIIKSISSLSMFLYGYDPVSYKHYVDDCFDLLRDLHTLRTLLPKLIERTHSAPQLPISIQCLIALQQHYRCWKYTEEHRDTVCNFPCCDVPPVPHATCAKCHNKEQRPVIIEIRSIQSQNLDHIQVQVLKLIYMLMKQNIISSVGAYHKSSSRLAGQDRACLLADILASPYATASELITTCFRCYLFLGSVDISGLSTPLLSGILQAYLSEHERVGAHGQACEVNAVQAHVMAECISQLATSLSVNPTSEEFDASYIEMLLHHITVAEDPRVQDALYDLLSVVLVQPTAFENLPLLKIMFPHLISASGDTVCLRLLARAIRSLYSNIAVWFTSDVYLLDNPTQTAFNLACLDPKYSRHRVDVQWAFLHKLCKDGLSPSTASEWDSSGSVAKFAAFGALIEGLFALLTPGAASPDMLNLCIDAHDAWKQAVSALSPSQCPDPQRGVLIRVLITTSQHLLPYAPAAAKDRVTDLLSDMAVKALHTCKRAASIHVFAEYLQRFAPEQLLKFASQSLADGLAPHFMTTATSLISALPFAILQLPAKRVQSATQTALTALAALLQMSDELVLAVPVLIAVSSLSCISTSCRTEFGLVEWRTPVKRRDNGRIETEAHHLRTISCQHCNSDSSATYSLEIDIVCTVLEHATNSNSLVQEATDLNALKTLAHALITLLCHLSPQHVEKNRRKLQMLVVRLITHSDVTLRAASTSYVYRLLEAHHTSNSDEKVTAFSLLFPKSKSGPSSVSQLSQITSQELRPIETYCEVINEFIDGLDASESEAAWDGYLTSLGNLGLHLDVDSLPTILWLFITALLHSHPAARATAYIQMKTISHHMGTTPRDLIFEHGSFLFPAMLRALPSNPTIVEEVCEQLLYMRLDRFLLAILPEQLPPVIMAQNKEIVTRIAEMLDTEVSDLISEQMAHILRYYFMEQSDNLRTIADFLTHDLLRGTTFSNLTRLVKHCVSDLTTCLIRRFSGTIDERQKAERALRFVIGTANGDYDFLDRQPEPQDKEILSEFLKTHALKVFAELTSVLVKGSRSKTHDKLGALRCLKWLMTLLGPNHLTAFVPKVMATLKLALQDSSIAEQVCELWLSFCQILDISSVGPYIYQLILTLLPYVDEPSCSGHVVNTFEYLFVTNREHMKPFLKLIPTLPDSEPLREVFGPLKEEMGKTPVLQQLRPWIGVIGNESSNVRRQSLVQVRKILSTIEFRDILCQPSWSPEMKCILEELVLALLRRCADAENDIRLECARCIGELGAIDPTLISVTVHEKTASEIVNTDDLARHIISDKLVSTLRAAGDTRSQDRTLYAIQELLKFCGVTEATPELFAGSPDEAELRDRGVLNWSKLSPDVRELVYPCLHSQYEYTEPSVNAIIANRKRGASDASSIDPLSDVHTFFHPKYSRRRWLADWTRYLSTQFLCDRSDIYQALRGVMKTEVNVSIFVLPYLVVDALRFGSAHVIEQIRREIVAVLEFNQTADQNIAKDAQLCSQSVFELLNHVTIWLEACSPQGHKRTHRAFLDQLSKTAKRGYEEMQNWLDSIPRQLMAHASFRWNAFTRALKYMEAHIREEKRAALHCLQAQTARKSSRDRKGDGSKAEKQIRLNKEDLAFLQRIYAEIDEPDGMDGIAAMREKPLSLQDQVTDAESGGKWMEAQMGYEQLLLEDSDNLHHHMGLVRCLSSMGLYSSAITHIKGVLHQQALRQRSDDRPREQTDTQTPAAGLLGHAIQASWRLGRWDLLDSHLEEYRQLKRQGASEFDFEYCLGNVLASMRHGKPIEGLLDQARFAVIRSLSAASRDSYRRSYDYFVQLQQLQEVERLSQLRDKKPELLACDDAKTVERLEEILRWKSSLDRTEPSFRVREALLSLRRTLHDMCGLKSLAGQEWLQFAVLARESDQLQAASSALHKAASCNMPTYQIERAKLLRAQGRHHEALMWLETEIGNHPPQGKMKRGAVRLLRFDERQRVLAESLVLIGQWMQESDARVSEEVHSNLNKALTMQPEWDRVHFALGQYFEERLNVAMKQASAQDEAAVDGSGSRRKRSSNKEDHMRKKQLLTQYEHQVQYLTLIIHSYGSALVHGTEFVFHALPSMLSKFFAFASLIDEASRDVPPSCEGVWRKLAEEWEKCKHCILDFADRLPAYQFLTCFSQIISRIGHESEVVRDFIEKVLIRGFLDYPQQAIWYMVAMKQSKRRERKERAERILSRVHEAATSKVQSLIRKTFSLIRGLTEICEVRLKKGQRSILVSKYFPNLKKFPGDVIIPFLSSLTVQLPTFTYPEGSDREVQAHRGFASDQICMVGLNNRIEVIHSKEAPRKILIQGSDGNTYMFLAKKEESGDMRKNSRMMEFCTVVNRLFKKSNEGRKRALALRTFAVVPLTEECGLIEWVPNTNTFRNLVNACNKKNNIEQDIIMIKDMYDNTPRNEQDRKRLYAQLCAMFAPTFHTWALEQFPEPTDWFEARLKYTRSAATWSMVGYCVGLGDRHGENILIDTTNGECVHVDFDCLFDKARALREPERVYFRLTPNIIDGFGVSGYEGVFRKSCEVTLNIIRSNRQSLGGVLESFIHDPLVEWDEKRPSHAERLLDTVRNRMSGHHDDGKTFRLSVSGQVHWLINDATSDANLAMMYIGWMPWF